MNYLVGERMWWERGWGVNGRGGGVSMRDYVG